MRFCSLRNLHAHERISEIRRDSKDAPEAMFKQLLNRLFNCFAIPIGRSIFRCPTFNWIQINVSLLEPSTRHTCCLVLQTSWALFEVVFHLIRQIAWKKEFETFWKLKVIQATAIRHLSSSSSATSSYIERRHRLSFVSLIISYNFCTPWRLCLDGHDTFETR